MSLSPSPDVLTQTNAGTIFAAGATSPAAAMVQDRESSRSTSSASFSMAAAAAASPTSVTLLDRVDYNTAVREHLLVSSIVFFTLFVLGMALVFYGRKLGKLAQFLLGFSAVFAFLTSCPTVYLPLRNAFFGWVFANMASSSSSSPAIAADHGQVMRAQLIALLFPSFFGGLLLLCFSRTAMFVGGSLAGHVVVAPLFSTVVKSFVGLGWSEHEKTTTSADPPGMRGVEDEDVDAVETYIAVIVILSCGVLATVYQLCLYRALLAAFSAAWTASALGELLILAGLWYEYFVVQLSLHAEDKQQNDQFSISRNVFSKTFSPGLALPFACLRRVLLLGSSYNSPPAPASLDSEDIDTTAISTEAGNSIADFIFANVGRNVGREQTQPGPEDANGSIKSEEFSNSAGSGDASKEADVDIKGTQVPKKEVTQPQPLVQSSTSGGAASLGALATSREAELYLSASSSSTTSSPAAPAASAHTTASTVNITVDKNAAIAWAILSFTGLVLFYYALRSFRPRDHDRDTRCGGGRRSGGQAAEEGQGRNFRRGKTSARPSVSTRRPAKSRPITDRRLPLDAVEMQRQYHRRPYSESETVGRSYV